jgi:hypothetical protein
MARKAGIGSRENHGPAVAGPGNPPEIHHLHHKKIRGNADFFWRTFLQISFAARSQSMSFEYFLDLRRYRTACQAGFTS